MKKTLAAIAAATTVTVTMTACNPYAPRNPAIIDEIEAGSLTAINGVDLWVRMITEGDFAARCTGNLGGTLEQNWAGYVCVVKA
jgi:hypothetical protein